MARWLLTILEGRHANDVKGRRRTNRSSDRASSFSSSPFPSILRSKEVQQSHPIEFPFRTRRRRRRRGRMHAIFPFIRATHTYTQRIAGIASGSWNLKGRTRRANKFGVNSRFEKSGGIERRRKWWRQFYGNACGEGGEGSADICITRAPTRYRRVCKPAFLHLMYTFHVAANCTGRRRKDSGASARRYYVTCRSIMIPPSR